MAGKQNSLFSSFKFSLWQYHPDVIWAFYPSAACIDYIQVLQGVVTKKECEDYHQSEDVHTWLKLRENVIDI